MIILYIDSLLFKTSYNKKLRIFNHLILKLLIYSKMEYNLSHIQNLPENQILRHDDHRLKISTYIEIHSQNFEFNGYNHGTVAMKQHYGITKNLFRYFNKRNFLFHKFQSGIEIDEESWYSAIPEPVSHYLNERFLKCNINKIFEPFCGIGGIAIHLSDQYSEYVVNDIDSQKIKMLKHNMKVYGKSESQLQYFNSDFLKVKPFKTDAVVVCPPWGGISTEQYSYRDLDEIMVPKLSDIMFHAMKFSDNIMLQMPKNTNLENLLKIFHKCQIRPMITIEKILTNGKVSQLFIYIGSQNFMKINSSLLYNQLYKDLDKQNKIERRQTKNALKVDCRKVMINVFKTKYPNKIIYFD